MRERRLVTFVTGAAVIVALFQLYASFAPTAGNWSSHHLSFFTSPVRLIVFALTILVLVPFVQRLILRGLDRLVRMYVRQSLWRRRFLLLGALACVSLLLWTARERSYFLGDGYLVLRNMGQVHNVTTIPSTSFRDAPSAALLVREVAELLPGPTQAFSDEFAFQIVSIVCGIGWIFGSILAARTIAQTAIDRAFIVLFFCTFGGIQLFFGYVEVYALAALLLLLFHALSMSHLRHGASFLPVSALFGALLTAHFGMLLLLPAYLWMCLLLLRAGKLGKLTTGLATMVSVFLVLMLLAEFTPERFLWLLAKGGSHFVPLVLTDSGHAYAMFSQMHITEIGNLIFLSSPLALIMLLGIVALFWDAIRWRDHPWMFVTIALVFCGVFIAVMYPDLGMSRDWDVFSLFTIPILFAAVLGLFSYVPSEPIRRRILLIAVSVGILHAIPWIAVNASEGPALARFGLLNDSRYWGRTAVLDSYDELSSYYRTHDDLKKGREYYEKYIEIDSSNGRILGNCGSICQDLGDKNAAIGYYERAIRHNTIVKTAYSDLAKLYSVTGRNKEAIGVGKAGLARGFVTADAVSSVGVFIIKESGSYGEALPYFERAILLDSTYDQAYLNAGVSCSFLNRQAEMARYFSRFLELRPDYSEANRLREAIAKFSQK